MIRDLCIYGFLDYENLEHLLPKIFSFKYNVLHSVDVNQALLC